MQIDDTELPFEPAWEGALETGGEMFTVRGRSLPRASIGRPSYWAVDARLDLSRRKVQSGPAEAYGLARFPFSLRPADDVQVKRVDFTVALYPSGSGPRPVAYDAHPPTTIVEREGEVTLSLGPDFKFAGAEASLAKVAGTIKLKQGVAAITVDGIGESDVRWVFMERAGRPLLGSLVVYVVVARPGGIAASRASVRLSASMNSRWGQFVGRLPETAGDQLSWVLS